VKPGAGPTRKGSQVERVTKVFMRVMIIYLIGAIVTETKVQALEVGRVVENVACNSKWGQ
jgi:hypothetical protein